MNTEILVIDAANGILGRIASYAAKQTLLGKNTVILNCSGAIITGNRRSTISIYNKKRALGGSSLKGPFFPKHPERLMKRTIRGMLPYKQERGRTALKKIKCFTDAPREYDNYKKISFSSNVHARKITIGELSKEI